MIPLQAVVKAVSKGWWPISYPIKGDADASFVYDCLDWENMALDPTFWQALGKAMKWGKDPKWGNVGRDGYINVWQSYAMDFYDLVLIGGDMTKFWDELLN